MIDYENCLIVVPEKTIESVDIPSYLYPAVSQIFTDTAELIQTDGDDYTDGQIIDALYDCMKKLGYIE